MDLVDDATGLQRLGVQRRGNARGAAVTVLRRWITAYGVPRCLYTGLEDRVICGPPTEAERAAGTVPLTQFGRMVAALGIRIIGARSRPQAKGRGSASMGRTRTGW